MTYRKVIQAASEGPLLTLPLSMEDLAYLNVPAIFLYQQQNPAQLGLSIVHQDEGPLQE